ncbi:MAG: TIGR02996 domain-containing protein [Planctomycetes bacterium]|nr:TIGR02996 domain-containing protein [Planctomycetota bacterium]
MSTHNLTHDALNAEILAHPAEDTARLAFADLLDEQGENARAEFIRTQIRLATLNEWDEGYTATDVRCRRLLAEHPEWLDRVKVLNGDLLKSCGSLDRHIGCGPHSVFVRGFPGVVAAQAEWFADSYSELFSQFPIEAVGFAMDCPSRREALLDCPGVGRLRGLGISMWGDEREGWDALVHFRHLERLERLEVYSEAIVTDTFQTFLESPKFTGLESFSLTSDCGDAGRRPADAIRESDRNGWLFGLRDLALDGSEFEGLTQRLARDSGWVPRLTRLQLRGYLGEYGPG